MKYEIWILIILLVFGFLTRVYRFGQIPESLYWDEAAIGLDARSIIETNKDLNNNFWLQPLFYSYGDFKAPVYIWLVTIFGLFFKVSETVIRLPSLIASALMALILFKLLKLLAPKKSILPLCAVVSFLIMPWSFHFGRIGMESYLSLLWLLLMVYFQTLSFKRKKPVFMVLAAIFGVLGIYSYIAARIMVIVLYIAVPLIVSRKFSKMTIIGFLIGLSILGAGTVFLMKSPSYKASQNYRLSNSNLIRTTDHIEKSVLAQSNSRHTILSRVYYHRYWYWLQEYLKNYFTHFSPGFLMFNGDNNLRHHSGFGGQLLFVQGILLVFGLYFAFPFQRKADILMMVWLASAPAVASLVNEAPHASRAVYMIIPLSWLAGLGMEGIYKNIKSMELKQLVFFGIILALLLNFALFLHDYFVHYPARSDLAWMAPYKRSALYFKSSPTEKNIFITDQWYQPGLYFAYYGNIPSAKLQGSHGRWLKSIDKFNFYLPPACPKEALCVMPASWQMGESETILNLPGTDKLVIKEKSL